MITIVVSSTGILVDSVRYESLNFEAFCQGNEVGIRNLFDKSLHLIRGKQSYKDVRLNGNIELSANAFVVTFNSLIDYYRGGDLRDIKENSDYPSHVVSQVLAVPAVGAVRVANVNAAGYVTLTASEENTGDIYIGGSDVSANSYAIEPGKSVPIEHANLSQWYALAESAEDILFVAGSYK